MRYPPRISFLAFRTGDNPPDRLCLHLLRECFPSRATPLDQGRGQICLLRARKRPRVSYGKRFLRHLSVPTSFLPSVSFPAAPFYPVGRGSAQILRKIAPNTRRVRCPSANA